MLENQIISEFTLIRKIGEGGFGSVYRAVNNTTGLHYALKLIPKSSLKEYETELRSIIRYSTKSSQIYSPHIMRIESIGSNDEFLYYAMPLCDFVNSETNSEDQIPLSLEWMITQQKLQTQWFTINELIQIAISIAKGLVALHEHDLLHRDIKPSNILYLNSNPCIADIGILGIDQTVLTRIGTPMYQPPSYFTETGGNVDIWGFALTLYTLLTGNHPDKLGKKNYDKPPGNFDSSNDLNSIKWYRIMESIYRMTDEEPDFRLNNFSDIIQILIETSNYQRIDDQDTTNFPNSIEAQALPINGSDKESKRRKIPKWLISISAIAVVILPPAIASFLFPESELIQSKQRQKHPDPELDRKNESSEKSILELSEDEKKRYMRLALGAAMYNNEGKPEAALSNLKILLNDYPAALNSAPLWNTKAEAHLELGQYQEAFNAVSKSMEIKENANALTIRIQVWKKLQDYAGAEKDYDRAIELEPDSSQHVFNRGKIKIYRGNLSGGIEDMNRAIEMEEDQGLIDSYNLILTDLNKEMGKQTHQEESSSVLTDSDQARFKETQTLIVKCMNFKEERSFKDALSVWNRLTIEYPDMLEYFPNAHAQVADIYLILEDYTQALQLAQKSIDMKPNMPGLEVRAQVHAHNGNTELALQDFQSAINISPSLPFTYYKRADFFIQQKEYQRAIADLEIATGMDILDQKRKLSKIELLNEIKSRIAN